MRRSALTRHTRLARGTPLRPKGEGKRKREARTRKLRQSPHTKAIRLERLALCRGQCEGEVTYNTMSNLGVGKGVVTHRCPGLHNEPFSLEMHHLTYKRLGHEDIDDVRMLCWWHHDEAERKLRPWKYR